MTTTKMSAKGWLVIPRLLREKYGLLPGRRVQFVDYAGVLSLHAVPDDPIEHAFGLLRRLGMEGSATEELLEERRRDLEREEQAIASRARP